MTRNRETEKWPTDEEVRDRVDRVMAGWNAGVTFAEVLDELLSACDFLGNKSFSRLYRERTGRSLHATEIGRCRKGDTLPTYQFIEDLANHTLLLPLDPDLFRAAGGGRPPGERRVQLFASAGLIEVTPESTRQWNREVLARHDRLRTSRPAAAMPAWRQIMHKLADFQQQGGRTSVAGLAEEARAAAGDPSLFPGKRLVDLLNGGETTPSEKERVALYRVLGLDDDQVRSLEEGLDAGDVPLREHYPATAFTRHLSDILERLRAAGISSTRLALLTADPVSGQPGIRDQSTLSAWKRGASSPTAACLRDAVRGLARCVDGEGRRLVPPEEVEALVREAGFEPEELSLSCHEVIARVTAETRIQPLLAAIRNAPDVSVPMSAVSAMDHGRNARPVQLARTSIHEWETSPGKFPTPAQVRELLDRYSIILRRKGHAPLSAEEIDKVVAVAERDRERWRELPQEAKRSSTRSTRRMPPSPTFDDGPSR